MRSQPFGRPSGFTLVELIVAIAIMGMALGAGMGLMRRGFSHQGRQVAARVQTTIRYFYNQAVLTGKVHRLVLTLSGDAAAAAQIGFEVAEGDYVHRAVTEDTGKPVTKKTTESEDAASPAGGDGEEKVSKSAVQLTAPNATKFSALHKDGGLMAPIKIPTGVLLAEVRFPGREEPQIDGTVYIYAFPQGAIDAATIIFANPAKTEFFVLRINPLTGVARASRKLPEGR